MGSRAFSCTLKYMLRLHKPEILGLMETKISGEQAYRFCNSLRFDYWIIVEIVGFSGGI